MINVDSHSFNNNVLEQINKIKTALSKITPDNVKYFDDSLLRRARGVVNEVEEYKWNGNCTINSISVESIKRMTDYLKTDKYEYCVLDNGISEYRIVADSYTGFGEDEYGTAQINYKVPDNFDGRNSFVVSFFKYGIDNLVHKEYSVGYLSPQRLINKDNSSYNVYKNKNVITIKSILPAKYAPDHLSEFILKNVVFLWRKK